MGDLYFYNKPIPPEPERLRDCVYQPIPGGYRITLPPPLDGRLTDMAQYAPRKRRRGRRRA